MRYVLISIKDRAIDAYHPVANVRAEGEALRVFNDLLRDQNSPQSKHPDDYDLYIVGYFDDQTGQLEPLDSPRKIADGKAMTDILQPGQE